VKTVVHPGLIPPAQGRITVWRRIPSHGIRARQVVRAVRMALGSRQCGNLTIAMVDDRDISRLHEQFMADPTPTDVLTFDLRDRPDDDVIDAEIIVSTETAERQARSFGADPGQELLRYAIHGTLHLIGFDDRTPAQRRRMRREENRILAALADEIEGGRRGRRMRRKRSGKARRTGHRV
jgi:probable rRNA maturation factor